MASQTPRQKRTVARVMHEYKQGELDSGPGGKAGPVKNPRQAIAIALSEAGASNEQTPARNRRRRARTAQKEKQGQAAQSEKTGQAEKNSGGTADDAPEQITTHAQLLKKAREINLPGRSRMTNDQLKRALRFH